MKFYYDLHIHSVLSPCADVLMTPNNILNMCMLKELDIISIADHNGAKQYGAIESLEDSFDFLVIYGIEVTVKEGFHVLVYFESLDKLYELDKFIDSVLDKNIKTKKNMEIGVNAYQIVCDEYDEEKYQIPYLLNQNSISFKKLIEVSRKLGGLIIPAHIDRKGTGILEFIKDFSEYDIDGIEVYKKNDYDSLIKEYPYLIKYKAIYDSDAHDIEMINEKVNYLELDDLSFQSFKKYFKGD